MAYNDTKGTGDSLTAAEWNAMVIVLENTTSGHDHDGTDSKKVTGTNVEGMTASRAIVSGATGLLAAATTTATEIGYVNGVTSAIQTQLGTKAPTASPTFTGTTKRSTTAGITAFATGGQASAVALTTDINEVSVCATNGDSVKLPAAVAGMEIITINHGAATLDIFPISGDFINEQAVNTAVSIAIDATAVAYCYIADYWEITEVTRA